MSGFEDILSQLRAAGEATRLRILLLLREGEMTVTELTEVLGQSQPRVSRHMKVLAEAGLVERFQEGAWGFYRLTDPHGLDPALRDPGLLLPPEDREGFEKIRARRAASAAAYFAAHAESWESWRARYLSDAAIESALLELTDRPIDLFLDFGTGTGRMLMLFAPLYRRGIGYDTSAEMLTIARVRLDDASVHHAQVRRADLLSVNGEPNADIVCLHHVLHFLTAPEKAIAAAARRLSGTGAILIADFAPHAREELREEHAHRRLGFDDPEIARWGRRSNLAVTASVRLDPPGPDGLETRIWRLERRNRSASTANDNDDVPFTPSEQDAHVAR